MGEEREGFLRVDNRDRDVIRQAWCLEDPLEPGESHQQLPIHTSELGGQERGVHEGRQRPAPTPSRMSPAVSPAFGLSPCGDSLRPKERRSAPSSIFEAASGAAGCIPAEPASSDRTLSLGALTVV